MQNTCRWCEDLPPSGTYPAAPLGVHVDRSGAGTDGYAAAGSRWGGRAILAGHGLAAGQAPYPWGTMTGLIEHILDVSGSVLLAVLVAVLAAALFSRPAPGPGGSPPAAGRVPPPASR